MTKHTIVTFLLAAGVALVLTPARRHLFTRWPWMGAGIAVLIMAPNLRGRPHTAGRRSSSIATRPSTNQPVGPLQVLLQQVLMVSPGAVPVWAAGLLWLLKRRTPDLRHLGLTFLILLGLLMASGQSRPDRILGIYPLMFAAGGVALEAAASRRWVSWTAAGWLAAWGLVLLPIGVPVLPPEQLAAYATAVGGAPQLERAQANARRCPSGLPIAWAGRRWRTTSPLFATACRNTNAATSRSLRRATARPGRSSGSVVHGGSCRSTPRTTATTPGDRRRGHRPWPS